MSCRGGAGDHVPCVSWNGPWPPLFIRMRAKPPQLSTYSKVPLPKMGEVYQSTVFTSFCLITEAPRADHDELARVSKFLTILVIQSFAVSLLCVRTTQGSIC